MKTILRWTDFALQFTQTLVDMKKNHFTIYTLDTDIKALEESGLELCCCCKFAGVYGYSWTACNGNTIHGMFPEEGISPSKDFFRRCVERVMTAKNYPEDNNRILICPTVADFVAAINEQL